MGEALWDLFPDGARPGGAPCNVAYHAARLGDRGVIVTRVGNDRQGSKLVRFLRDRGVRIEYVQWDSVKPTGTVSVTVTDEDPEYKITEDVAWDYIAIEDEARSLVRVADAICVGSLAQRCATSRNTIQQLLAETNDDAIVIFDVNLRPPFIDATVIEATLRLVDVVKMNQAEVEQLSVLLKRPSLLQWLLYDIGVYAVCVTRGAAGAAITTADGVVTTAGVAATGASGDTVGAGDAFTAAIAHQLVRGVTLSDALTVANRYAALVANRKGAMPDFSAEELAGIGLPQSTRKRTARSRKNS